jgi:hypothetical protein
VAVTAIKARCRRCRQDFHLFEVLDQRDGTCPRCGWSLSHHWTATLLEEAARADIAQRHLVAALRRLRNLPGNVLLRPHTVLRNLFEEVGWHTDLADDTVTLQEELPELRQLLAAWELLDPAVTAAVPHRGRIRRVVDWFKGHTAEFALTRGPTTSHLNESDSRRAERRDVRVPLAAAVSSTIEAERPRRAAHPPMSARRTIGGGAAVARQHR